MFDQIIIGNIGSFDDFGASVAERKVSAPSKKIVKESVPFSNVTHDFSKINGEIYWEERTLEYVFEILADSPEELEERKRPFLAWVMNVMNGELHDPFIKKYHFIATYADMEIDDSEIEKSTISVQFTAYPYMVANEKTVRRFPLTLQEKTVKIENASNHRIVPTISNDVECIIKLNGSSYGIPAGSEVYDAFKLEPGENVLTIQAAEKAGSLLFEFFEEVF